MTTPQAHEYPELPSPACPEQESGTEGNWEGDANPDWYSAEQMHAYGQACYDAALKSSPVQSDVEAMLSLLEDHEWAEHVAQTEIGKRLESAITEFVGRPPPVQAEVVAWVLQRKTEGHPNFAPGDYSWMDVHSRREYCPDEDENWRPVALYTNPQPPAASVDFPFDIEISAEADGMLNVRIFTLDGRRLEHEELIVPPQPSPTQASVEAVDLHPATEDLVQRFAQALREKLAAAERKYGYSDGWLQPNWMDECRQKLAEHVAKGDPRDVAAYCAFLWHHGERTAQAGAVGWRCFYCDEVFVDRESAHLHFGAGGIFDHKTPGCQIDLAAYRAMEETVRRYQEEDASIHRSMHRMAGEHSAAMQRAEEAGYARGLKDAEQPPQASAADVEAQVRPVAEVHVESAFPYHLSIKPLNLMPRDGMFLPGTVTPLYAAALRTRPVGVEGIIDGEFGNDGNLTNRIPWRVFRDDDGALWLTTDNPERDIEIDHQEGGAPQVQVNAGDADALARSLYATDCANDPHMHSNRFPAWNELSEAAKKSWRDQAARTVSRGESNV